MLSTKKLRHFEGKEITCPKFVSTINFDIIIVKPEINLRFLKGKKFRLFGDLGILPIV